MESVSNLPILGKTIISIDVSRGEDIIIFKCTDGTVYKMYHCQDCCECVTIEDIAGDIEKLIGKPLLMAEEVYKTDEPEPICEYDESYTWTFYKLGNINGYVTIRWYGSSNGYYSERVEFEDITEEYNGTK